MPIAYLCHADDPQFIIVLPETLEEVVQEAKDCYSLPDDATVLIYLQEEDYEAVLTKSGYEWLKSESKDWRHVELRVKNVEECEDLAKRMKEKQERKGVTHSDFDGELQSLQLEESKMDSFELGAEGSPISSTSEGNSTIPTAPLLSESFDDPSEVPIGAPSLDLISPLKLVITVACSGERFELHQNSTTLTLTQVYKRVEAFLHFRHLGQYHCGKTCPHPIDLFSLEHAEGEMPDENMTLGEWIMELREKGKRSDWNLMDDGLRRLGLQLTLVTYNPQP